MLACQTYGASLPGASVYLRKDWNTFYFDLCGKQFGLMKPDVTKETFITLKNNPDTNLEFRDSYKGIIIPGYYANKKHWNSIKLASDEITIDFLNDLIKTSYCLVFEKLPKKDKEIIFSQKS